LTEQPSSRPPTYDELTDENRQLKALALQQQRSIGSLQAKLVSMEAEVARALHPKRQPHILDPKAKDSFQRPFGR
jgi:hypothetical protein